MSSQVAPPASRPTSSPAPRPCGARPAARAPGVPPFGARLAAALALPGDAAAAKATTPGAAGAKAAVVPDRGAGAAPQSREHGPRRLDRTLDAEVLAPFAPPPSVLAAPPGSRHEVPSHGDAADRAQTAALVDRLVRSMHVGRVGRG